VPATHVHPLFALPFRRLGLPASALVIGAMAPDVAYVVGAPGWGRHDLLGIFAFSLPVGLVALGLYERLVAPALGLPRDPRLTDPKRWPWAAVGIVVGASTHVFVDGFTHSSGWAASQWPALRLRPAVLPTYRWLQYGTSVVGTGVLLYVGRRPLLRRLQDPRALGALGAVLLLALTHGAWVASDFEGLLQARVFVVRSVAAALVLGAAGLVLHGAWHRVRHRPAPAAS
jgi:hypothetical protein